MLSSNAPGREGDVRVLVPRFVAKMGAPEDSTTAVAYIARLFVRVASCGCSVCPKLLLYVSLLGGSVGGVVVFWGSFLWYTIAPITAPVYARSWWAVLTTCTFYVRVWSARARDESLAQNARRVACLIVSPAVSGWV